MTWKYTNAIEPAKRVMAPAMGVLRVVARMSASLARAGLSGAGSLAGTRAHRRGRAGAFDMTYRSWADSRGELKMVVVTANSPLTHRYAAPRTRIDDEIATLALRWNSIPQVNKEVGRW